MNYLAHLYLADANPDSLIGSLMGDFAKGPVDSRLAPAIAQGILVHRKIDAFTDTHPAVIASKRRIRPMFRHYRGLLVDIFYDHFLARNWSQYSSIPLSCFSRRAYQVLQVHYWSFPASMQHSVNHMIRTDLLVSYVQMAGIARALQGIETRLRRPYPLRSAILDLKENYPVLAADFKSFFPELVAFVTTLKASPTMLVSYANTANHGAA
jgi:acyl carrier protein phosphodiesterase